MAHGKRMGLVDGIWHHHDAFLLADVIWAIGNLGQRPPHDTIPAPRHDEPTALEILERRYANGELTNEEFEEKRTILLGSREGQS